jgi:hypothetical protein
VGQRNVSPTRLLRSLVALGLLASTAGCLGSMLAPPDGGVDVGDNPDLAGVFGPEDAGTVAQADLAGFGNGGMRYHPLGYAAAEQHGPELKLQKQDCRVCHGSDLKGGSAGVSCDGCHTPNWRTTCTFCHGGANGDTTGLPPRDIDGELDPTKISFPAHQAHASGRITSVLACTQCHKPNLDVLSPGHIFTDGTPGRAEVFLAGGLSPQGTYDTATKTCANNYCHGTGRSNGTIAFDAAPRTCHDCHADITTPAAWNTMSGDHAKHLRIGGTVNCTTCHNGTVKTDPLVISDKTRHLDGKRNIQFNADAAGITYDVNTRRCTGSCHGKNHNDTW